MHEIQVAGDLEELLKFVVGLQKRIDGGMPITSALGIVERRLTESLSGLQDALTSGEIPEAQRIRFIHHQLSFVFRLRNVVVDLSTNLVVIVDTIGSMLRGQFFASSNVGETDTMISVAEIMSTILLGIPEVKELPEGKIKDFALAKRLHNRLTNAGLDYYLPFEASPLMGIDDAKTWASKSLSHFRLYQIFVENTRYALLYNHCYTDSRSSGKDFVHFIDSQLSLVIHLPICLIRYLQMGLWGESSVDLTGFALPEKYSMSELIAFFMASTTWVETAVSKIEQQIAGSSHYLAGVKLPADLKEYEPTMLMSLLLFAIGEQLSRIAKHLSGNSQLEFLTSSAKHFRRVVLDNARVLTAAGESESPLLFNCVSASLRAFLDASSILVMEGSMKITEIDSLQEELGVQLEDVVAEATVLSIKPLIGLTLALAAGSVSGVKNAIVALRRLEDFVKEPLDRITHLLLLRLTEVCARSLRLDDAIKEIRAAAIVASLPDLYCELWEELEGYLDLMQGSPVPPDVMKQLKVRSTYRNPADSMSWIRPALEKKIPELDGLGFLPFNFAADKIVDARLPKMTE